MNELQLDPEEIRQMTGKKAPAVQIRELRRMGIRAERTKSVSRPVLVLRAWLAIPPERAPSHAKKRRYG